MAIEDFINGEPNALKTSTFQQGKIWAYQWLSAV